MCHQGFAHVRAFDMSRDPVSSQGAAPAENGARAIAPLAARLRPIAEALAIGLLVGLVDANNTNGVVITIGGYLLAGAVIGFRHAGRACWCWPVLGVTLYLAHVAAIAWGYKPPYVEADYRRAESNLLAVIPAGIGLVAGVCARAGLDASGWFRRQTKPPVRFLPRTTREVLALVASIAVGLACIHRVFFPPTIYAPRYREIRFQAIRPGMTSEQLESALGPPLEKRETGEPGSQIWIYSDQYTPESNYDRRWIFVTSGLVREILNDYWVD